MVLDKSYSLVDLKALLLSSSAFVDIWKIAWASAVVLPRAFVEEKCELLSRAGIAVCPGGTLFELAVAQGKVTEMMKQAKSLGFNSVEISNGTVRIDQKTKLDFIKQALDEGFRVLSEVGSKFEQEDRMMTMDQRAEYAQAELSCGAWKVIIEARESGTLGIFDERGAIEKARLQRLLELLPADQVIFESPLKSQQLDLIVRLGPNVNLGNVAPVDLVSLETLRLGLRADTMRMIHGLHDPPMRP